MSTKLTLSEGLALASAIDARDGTTRPVTGGSAEVAAMLQTLLTEMRRRAELLDSAFPATGLLVVADEAQRYYDPAHSVASGAGLQREVA